MSRSIRYLAVLSLLWLSGHSLAGELCDRTLARDLQCTRCAAVACWCPDDYCRKPLPCLPCLAPPCCPDDYCRKPLPCVDCLCGPWCPDDYCRKPLPLFCPPNTGTCLRCK